MSGTVLDQLFDSLAKARAERAQLVADIGLALAEIERLRAALTEIADAPFAAVGLSRASDHNQLIDIARKALDS